MAPVPQKRKKQIMAPESSLPMEVITEIIARLPVKTIGRCRCLSKSWYSFIVQPYFINKQRDMSHTVASGEAENHLMVMHQCGFYELMKSSNPPRDLKFPKEAGDIRGMNLIGSCDGLLGLEDLETVVLWNPLFHKFKIIRKSQLQIQMILEGGFPTYTTLGFCFVPQTCDYKMITFEEVPIGWPQIEIYSLKADAWKMWDGHRSKNLNRYVWINKNSPLTCVRGKAHGIVRKTVKTIQGEELEEIIILAFNMLEEHFEEIPLPRTTGISFHVTDFQGSIALVIQHVPRCWEIWVMKDYGVSSSWTILYNLYHMKVVPFDIINDGRVILQLDMGTFAVYDPIRQIETKLSEVDLCWNWTICKETLALLA